jgi:hypothetical protein
MQTRALVDFGELSLNRAMQVYGPVGDLSIFKGRYYPSKAPLMSFAAVPVYAVLRELAGSVPEIPLVFFSRLVLTILPTLLSLLLVESLLRRYVTSSTALGVTWTYALGTLAFSYSLLFMSHQTTATFLFAGFYTSWRRAHGERSLWHPTAAGFLLGLAVAAEYTSALPAFVIGGYATLTGRRPADRARSALALLAGAFPLVVFLAWYHRSCFGGILETGYRHLADVAYQPWHQGGFLGIKTPTAEAFVGSFFSPLRGLLSLSPVLILGFVGLPRVWRARHERSDLGPMAVFTMVLVAGYVYFTSSFSYASWGWTTGPRHLTGLVPFLLLPTAVQLESARSQLGRGAAAGLALSAILVTSALTFINYIPDDVSEAFFGLFNPLANAGYLVPTVPAFLGFSSPAGGWLVISLSATAALITGAVLLRAFSWRAVVGLTLVVATVLAFHRAAYRDTEQDRAARALLRRVWLTPPGQTVIFWSTSGRPRA